MPFLTEYAQITGSDIRDNARKAAAALKTAFAGKDLCGLLFYAATNYDPRVLVQEMHQAFPGVSSFGCTTGGEFARGTMLAGSVVAMGFTPDVMEVIEAVGYSGVDHDETIAERAAAALEAKIGLAMRDLDFRQYAGWLLVDGLADGNDHLVERGGELTDIIFAGGCAGDDGKFRETLVWANGDVYENGAVFVLMKPRGKFAVLKTQAVEVTDREMIATTVNREERVIHQFDSRPAVLAYADAMGVSVDGSVLKDGGKSRTQLLAEALVTEKPDATPRETVNREQMDVLFMKWPLALVIGGEPFLRSALTVAEGGGVKFYLPPRAGLRYTLTRATDVVAGTRKILTEKKDELGRISAIMSCGCMLRDVQIRNDNECDAYQDLFRDFPTVAFSSYGEIYIGVVSHSAAMIVFA